MRALDGVRVVELAANIAGPYCAKLLVDAGASVVKLDEPGDRLRERIGGRLADYLRRGKVIRSGEWAELASDADLLITDRPVAAEALWSANPALTIITITPFGLEGPWADRPASELTLQAAGGSTGKNGEPTGPPLALPGRIAEWMAGAYAAVGGLGGYWGVKSGGHGRLIDVAILDVVASSFSNAEVAKASSAGWPPVKRPVRVVHVPAAEPTADGYVVMAANTTQQFRALNTLMGHPELSDDDDLRLQFSRTRRRDEYQPFVREWTTARTTEQIVQACAQVRVPCGPVLDAATIRDFPHFVERGVFAPCADGWGRLPRPPYRIHGAAPADAAPCARPEAGWPRLAAGDDLPLDGVRIVDLTMWWAGPANVNLLAALGADVVKIESCHHVDPNRLMHLSPPADGSSWPWWDAGAIFIQGDCNRRGVAIELDQPEGMQIFERLLTTADLLIENFAPRVLENFGLTPERLHELNPRLVTVRMPAFGLDGPLRNSTGFASTIEAMTGIAARTGFPTGGPVPPMGIGDPMAGVHAAVATLVGLFQARRDGHGNVVEAPMVEAGLNVTVEALLHYDATGEVLGRIGNRDLVMAPQGLYQCVGDDVWIALTVEDDAQWQALRDVLGRPSWSADPALATAAGRREHHDRIDAELGQWFAGRDVEAAVDALIAKGIPAAEAIISRDAYFNPQLRHRGLHPTIHHPVAGDTVITLEVPFRLNGVTDWIRRPAPTLGQHNAEVLREIGFTDDEISKLASMQVIGDRMVQ